MNAAWIIDEDLAAAAELRETGRCEDNARGYIGPPDAPPGLVYALERGYTAMFRVMPFKAFTDEGTTLVYVGRVITDHLSSEVSMAMLVELSARAGVDGIEFVRSPELNVDAHRAGI